MAAKGSTSRTAAQIALEASSPTSSAAPNALSRVASERARSATDTSMPSTRTSVSASPGAPSWPSAPLPPRSADAGTCAAAETSKDEPSAAVIARLAARSSSPRSTSVISLSGCGITFSVTSVITDSVPHEPASSLHRS